MKAYGGVDLQDSSSSVLYGGECLVSRPSHFNKGGKLPVPTEKENGLDSIWTFGEEINFPPYWESDTISLTYSLVTKLNTLPTIMPSLG